MAQVWFSHVTREGVMRHVIESCHINECVVVEVLESVMCHTWSTNTNQPCHICHESVMSHMSRIQSWLMYHGWNTNQSWQSCHTWSTNTNQSWQSCHTRSTNTNQSSHTRNTNQSCDWVMSHIWMCHGGNTTQSCVKHGNKYESVMCHTCHASPMSCLSHTVNTLQMPQRPASHVYVGWLHTYKYVMLEICISLMHIFNDLHSYTTRDSFMCDLWATPFRCLQDLRVMSHVSLSHVTHARVTCHTWMSHVTLWRTPPKMSPRTCESCHTYDSVMSYIWMSHVKTSHITYECVISRCREHP